MKFYKMEVQELKSLDLKEGKNVYVLEKEGIIVGYGIVTNDSSNKIQIYIKEDYRSNGYGKILFKKMIEELKKEKYNELKLTINKENYRMKNIIVFYGGHQLNTTETEDSYILSFK